ncbi:hypothetical protein BGZ63DRAFT_400718 [Mariannaea sp. PMI_226]|nr:hypothetical protein BGZ63DRAFT_400718 [Mariannaea sp. PMI_226]
MEPALATVPGPGVPLPTSRGLDSDTISDTTSSPSDTRPASPSSPSSPAYHQFPPASPRNAAVHSQSQTVDNLSGSSSPTDSVTTAARPPSGPPIKRKPLSSTAAVLALRFSSSGIPLPSPLELPKPEQRFARSILIDSPTLYEFSPPAAPAPPPAFQRDNATLASHGADSFESHSIPRPELSPSPSGSDFSDVLNGYDDLIPDHKSDSHSISPETPLVEEERDTDNDSHYEEANTIDKDDVPDKEVSEPDQELDAASDATSIYSDTINSNQAPAPMLAPKPTPPHLKLDQVTISAPPDEPESASAQSPSGQLNTSPKLNKPLPRSPAPTSPFAALFSWAAPSPSGTEFSLSTPVSPLRGGANDTPYTTTSSTFSDGSKSNPNGLGYRESYLSSPAPPPSVLLEEMEEELKAISVELASSIRREMDLEDLVDRLQEQINNPQAPGKRSSDYFSDSGYSSAKMSESDQSSREEIEKIQRKSEQEKASIRLELTSKLQEERSRRKVLDQQIKHLAERASHFDIAEINNIDANGRLKDLENTCGDLRRRLSEERTVKNNFEDLLTALRGELQDACNERDNLRDEVVPQLRARVEGLETEAAEYSNLTYESSKMQQELQMLKKENDTLRHSTISGSATPPLNRMSRAMSGGLARSNSVATSSYRGQRPPVIQLSRSNSVKNVQSESREALSERLKDVEAQRDALHNALKSLLERQDFQNRENEKKIRILQAERERLLSASPRRGGFERDISNLRTEINVLRRRAEDALEEKWEVETGLTGLKMDLDRAEEEIALLRNLLEEKDILIPESFARSSGSTNVSGSFSNSGALVTSESLQKAYEELQTAYATSLERIKELELETSSDERTQLAMQRLEQTLAIAVSEREAAKHEIDALKSQFHDANASETKTLERERALADELSDSARRVGELASQVQHQLSTNADLRERLAATVARGDSDRKANSDRIADLQLRLKDMEDKLIAAQTASEERVARHEEEIASIQEAHNEQLRRMDSSPGLRGMRSPGLRSPRKPSLLSSPSASRFPISPRFPDKSFEEAAQMSALRERVTELEKALDDAAKDMQEVVAKMSAAQIEVLNLQEERETAVRETRKLQKILEQEQIKSFEDRFKTLSTVA